MEQGINENSLLNAGIVRSLEPGSLFDDRYQLLSILGKGAVGVVYRARDRQRRGTFVAIKLLHPSIVSDEVQLKRLENEVRFNRSLDHPNIVKTYEFAKARNGLHYITMECLEGESVAERIQRGSISFLETLRILLALGDAVAHAHSKGIVHRDLKPENIFISNRGKVTITDFGLARALDEDLGLTKSNEAVGTPYYMAPEQFRGAGPSSACDVYSLGVIAFELVTGERPFDADSVYRLAQAHMMEPLPSIAEMIPGTPCWFEGFVARAAAKKAADRFQNGEEFAKALQGLVEREHRALSPVGRMIQFIRPHGTLCTFLTSKGFPRRLTAKILGMLLTIYALGFVIRAVPQASQFASAKIIALEYRLQSAIASAALSPVKSYLGSKEIWSEANLLSAAASGELARLEVLLSAGMSLRTTTPAGVSLLGHAAGNKQPEIAQLLIRRGAKVNEKDSTGKTPLHHAVAAQAAKVVSILLAEGALIEAQDLEGKTPLDYARKLNDQAILEIMIQ